MLVKISQHLKKLAKKSKAIEKQFYPSKQENKFSKKAFIDPLLEDKYSPAKGLCHKYPHRILVELTLNCASFCRFCTRRRKVSDIKRGQLEKMVSTLNFFYFFILAKNRLLGDFSIQFHPNICNFIQCSSPGATLLEPVLR